MAKNKKKKKKALKNSYEVGYCKPPKEHQWVKGCKSPNPLGRPKKITSIREALQVNLGKEISVKNEDGSMQTISCADALVRKTIKDAITKDGPTRRMLYSKDFLHLQAKEPEYEYDEEETKIKEMQEVEERYGRLLHMFATMPEDLHEVFAQEISELLREVLNEKYREEHRSKWSDTGFDSFES